MENDNKTSFCFNKKISFTPFHYLILIVSIVLVLFVFDYFGKTIEISDKTRKIMGITALVLLFILGISHRLIDRDKW